MGRRGNNKKAAEAAFSHFLVFHFPAPMPERRGNHLAYADC
jgi:hypothetical protein